MVHQIPQCKNQINRMRPRITSTLMVRVTQTVILFSTISCQNLKSPEVESGAKNETSIGSTISERKFTSIEQEAARTGYDDPTDSCYQNTDPSRGTSLQKKYCEQNLAGRTCFYYDRRNSKKVRTVCTHEEIRQMLDDASSAVESAHGSSAAFFKSVATIFTDVADKYNSKKHNNLMSTIATTALNLAKIAVASDSTKYTDITFFTKYKKSDLFQDYLIYYGKTDLDSQQAQENPEKCLLRLAVRTSANSRYPENFRILNSARSLEDYLKNGVISISGQNQLFSNFKRSVQNSQPSDYLWVSTPESTGLNSHALQVSFYPGQSHLIKNWTETTFKKQIDKSIAVKKRRVCRFNSPSNFELIRCYAEELPDGTPGRLLGMISGESPPPSDQLQRQRKSCQVILEYMPD